MAEYQIFSDGACDIGFAKAKELGIGLIPFYISIDHETYYKEIQEISLEEYFRYMTEEKGYPKPSLPSIQDYMDAFRPDLEAGKDIICITMTRTLTASLESAVTAKSMLEEEFPHAQIHVINSWVATGAQALLLMEMARMQKDGKSLNEVITYAEKAREDARIHFMVGDLSYLEIGGRIGKVATISAGLLKIKPIIILKGGEICAGGICRARKKGLTQIASITAKHFKETGEN
ncbi:MAG TPA: DegV family protein, partial [Tyzzerella sp.]|nr:DegV family protein [Tyzzerella sp.]